MVRQALFRTIVLCVGASAVGFCYRGDPGLNSKYNKEKQEYIAMEKGGFHEESWLTGFLPKTGQGDRLSPGDGGG